VQLVADEAHQLQAGVVGFHHHVEQDERDIVVLLQHALGFGAAVRRQEREIAIAKAQPAQDHHGDTMDRRLVVDDQQLPGRQRFLCFVISQQQRLIIVAKYSRDHRVGLFRTHGAAMSPVGT
jgi:hypothetical protein